MRESVSGYAICRMDLHTGPAPSSLRPILQCFSPEVQKGIADGMMYDGRNQLLVAKPLKRYLLNSTMLKTFKYGSDGSLTFYVQKTAPGTGKVANWLPAPDGPFYAVLRVYMPAPEVLNGTWKKPPLQPSTH